MEIFIHHPKIQKRLPFTAIPHITYVSSIITSETVEGVGHVLNFQQFCSVKTILKDFFIKATNNVDGTILFINEEVVYSYVFICRMTYI